MSSDDTSRSTDPTPVRRSLGSRIVRLALVLEAGALAWVATKFVGRRIADGGVQQYGCDGAPYIEHVARLRVLQTLREGSILAPWKMLVDADGAFPPALHLLTLPVGAIFGHESEVALGTGPLWLVLLAVAVGIVTTAVAQGRGRRPGSAGGEAAAGFAAFGLVLVIPALQGFATRYYYDVPMTALIWASAAAFLGLRLHRPIGAALVAGVLLFLAALIKWSAIPLGLPILVGAAFCGRAADPDPTGLGRLAEPARRFALLAVSAAVTITLSLLYLAASGPENSYRRMTWETFEGVTPGSPMSGMLGSVLPGFLRTLVDQAGAGWERFVFSDLAFYPLRLAVSVLSPVLAIVFVVAVVHWWLRDRRGLPLVLAVLAVHGPFLVWIVPRLDDRFLLPGLPVLAVVAGCVWSRLKAPAYAGVLAAVFGLALLVSWDFHFGTPSDWTRSIPVLDGRGDLRPPTVARGWGAASSVQRLGWVRGDEEGSARTEFREALWVATQACREGVVAELDGRPILGGCGNRFWWEYRGDLDEAQGGTGRLRFVDGYVWAADQGGGAGSGPDLLLVGQEQEGGWRLPAGLSPGQWELHQRVEDVEGGPGAGLWFRVGSQACRAASALRP